MTVEQIRNISVIGLGKLGAPMAAVLANSSFNVIGLDLNQESVHSINNKIAPVNEPQLQNYIDNAGDNLKATSSYVDAIAESDVSFIIVPTPSQIDGLFSNDHVLTAIRKIGQEIAKKETYHLVVISSTVIPGSMNGDIKEALEKSSTKQLSKEQLGLCYNPEFIALGSVIENMLRPDITLIGESDSKAGDLLESIHQKVSKNNPEVHRLNFINAELTKISINTYVTTKISYANMLAELCDKLPGADVNAVTEAVGGDSRIGKKYLKGAIGYAGPCFPRDNKAFAALGNKVKVNCDIAVATDVINNRQIDRMFDYVLKVAKPNDRISILGLSYKTDTAEIDESQGIELCNRLNSENFTIDAYDPLANSNGRRVLTSSIQVHDILTESVSKADVIVIVTPWYEFKAVPKLMKSSATLIDPWRLCEQDAMISNLNYVTMGKSLD